MEKFNFEWFTRAKEMLHSKWRAMCFWKRMRYGTRFNDAFQGGIKAQAALSDDETLVMVLDDSPFRTRDKNVLLTDRRILYQNVKGGKYVSIELTRLKGASVFAERVANKTVLCMVCAAMGEMDGSERTTNVFAPVIAEIRLKHFAAPDALRTIFHDYLSKYCPGYLPYNADNYQYYKKTVSPMLHKPPAAAMALSIAGIVPLGVLALFDVVYCVRNDAAALPPETQAVRIIVCALLMLTLLAWTANVLIPNTKSKMSKLLLLWAFSVWCFRLDYYAYLPIIRRYMDYALPALTGQVLLTVKAVFVFLWLLFDKADFDRLTRIAAAAMAALFIVLALMGLAAGISFAYWK